MRSYKQLTSDAVLNMLKGRIDELEQQHWAAQMGLIASKAVVEAAPETGTQRATSEAEAEQLERNVLSLEAALDALVAELEQAEKDADNRAGRRAKPAASAA